MVFNHVIGIEEIRNKKIICRTALRAVILHNDNILMVHCNKGDYKFPGGGLNIDENYEEALIREVKEETGYIVNEIDAKLGVILERRLDAFEEDALFEMSSHYYLCNVSSEQTLQQLDDYEAELNFCPVWININEAILRNEEILKADSESNNSWVLRETLVLKELKDYFSLK